MEVGVKLMNEFQTMTNCRNENCLHRPIGITEANRRSFVEFLFAGAGPEAGLLGVEFLADDRSRRETPKQHERYSSLP